MVPQRLCSEHPNVGLTLIAASGGCFAGFSPYVPAIDDEGVVAFQAELRAGGSGVYTGVGEDPVALVEPGGGVISRVCSHPDRSRTGAVCFYGIDRQGVPGVFVTRGGVTERIAPNHGTLGPTINDAGTAAFRTSGAHGMEAVHCHRAGRTSQLASVGERYSEFRGLPVVGRGGSVLIRALLRSGAESIELVGGSGSRTIAETGATYASLGNFPCLNARGDVAFVGTHRGPGEGAFVTSADRTWPVALAGEDFESFRGVLIHDRGPIALIATPRRGSLGVYCLEPGGPRLLLQIGSSCDGTRVAEFALNPVSVNNRGQLSLRLGLEDGRGLIVRSDAT